jgi:hypothetical protein
VPGCPELHQKYSKQALEETCRQALGSWESRITLSLKIQFLLLLMILGVAGYNTAQMTSATRVLSSWALNPWTLTRFSVPQPESGPG